MASYTIKNGETYKVMSPNKVSLVVELKASNDATIEFRHEIESEDADTPITAERINRVLSDLAIQFEADQNVVLPSPILVFNEPISAEAAETP